MACRSDVKVLCLCMQLIEAGRDVVATSHTPDKLEKRLDSSSMKGEGRLHLENNVDITDSSALMQAELWKGVSQVVTTVGPAFGRQPDGSMGYAARFVIQPQSLLTLCLWFLCLHSTNSRSACVH